MKNIYDILDHIRQRPSMYFRKPSVRAIEEFTWAYYAGLNNHQIREEVPQVSQFHFEHWLANKFQNKYQWSGASGWAYALRKRCKSESQALAWFFELLNEYRQLRLTLVMKVTLANHHKPTGKRIVGMDSWPLPPKRLTIYRYAPEEFYFIVEHYHDSWDDRQTFASLDSVVEWAESCWQIKPEEWTLL